MCLVGWRITVVLCSPEIPTVLFIKDSLGKQLFYHTPRNNARTSRIPENLWGALPGMELLVETGAQQQTLSPPLSCQNHSHCCVAQVDLQTGRQSSANSQQHRRNILHFSRTTWDTPFPSSLNPWQSLICSFSLHWRQGIHTLPQMGSLAKQIKTDVVITVASNSKGPELFQQFSRLNRPGSLCAKCRVAGIHKQPQHNKGHHFRHVSPKATEHRNTDWIHESFHFRDVNEHCSAVFLWYPHNNS